MTFQIFPKFQTCQTCQIWLLRTGDESGVVEGVQQSDECVEGQEEGRDKRKKRDRLTEICNEPKAPIEDPWEPLTPQEAEETAPKRKPIRKGRTTKLPVAVVLSNLKKMSRSQRSQKKMAQIEQLEKKLKVSVPIEQYVIRELFSKYSIKDYQSGKLGRDLAPEFADIAAEVAARKKAENKVIKKTNKQLEEEKATERRG